jgi:hypothetical protein
MLKAYFDDAGTHAASPAVVLGGLIGTVDQWERLEKLWGLRLADPLPEIVSPSLICITCGRASSAVMTLFPTNR